MASPKGSVGLIKSLESPTTLIAFFEKEAFLSFSGCVQFKVLLGEIDVSGYMTTPNTPFQTLYSPASGSTGVVMTTGTMFLLYPVVLYSTRNIAEWTPSDHNKLGVDLNQQDIEQLNIILSDRKWSIVPLAAIALFKGTSTTLLEALKSYNSTSAMFTEKINGHSLIRNFNTVPFSNSMLVIPPAYRQLVADVSQSEQIPVIIVCGFANSGKSTFARFLTNYLLNKYPVLSFLECDVGQCEFTVPGVISLHTINTPIYGPSFVHLKTPEKAFVFGDTSPQSHPSFYLSLIRSCLEYYWHNHTSNHHPLIVNTCGWTTGLGIPILMDLIRLVSPSHVVQFVRVNNDPMDLPLLTHQYLSSAPSWSHMNTLPTQVPQPAEISSDIGMFSSSNLSTLKMLKSKGDMAVPIVISSEEEEEKEKEEEIEEEEREEGEGDNSDEDEMIEISGEKAVKRRHSEVGGKGTKKRKTTDNITTISMTATVQKSDLSESLKQKCLLFIVSTSSNWPDKHSGRHRQASIISYFSPLLSTLLPSSIKATTAHNFIMAATPYSVPWSTLAIRSVYKKVPPSQVLYAINGRFVWLGKVEDKELIDHGRDDSDGLFKHVRDLSAEVEYIGLGLVRGIEPNKRLIYITTPCPLPSLAAVNCIVAGNSERPSLFISQRHISSTCPYILQHFKHTNCGKLGYSSTN